MWQSLRAEFPLAAANSLALCKDWAIINAGDEWSERVLFPDPKDLMNQIGARVIAIVNGEKLNPGEVKLPEGDEDEEVGKLLGIVEDPRILSLFALANEIEAYRAQIIAVDGTPFDALDEAAQNKWIETQVVSDVRRFEAMRDRAFDSYKLVMELFWRAVRDTMPSTEDIGTIVLRPGWKVYQGFDSLSGLEESLDELIGLSMGGGPRIISGNSPLGRMIMRSAKMHGLFGSKK